MTLPDFDELNTIRLDLGAAVYDMAQGRRFDRKRCEDIIFDLLTMAYAWGIEKAGIDFDTPIPINRDMEHDSIYRPTAGKDFAERINEHVDAANEAVETGGEDITNIATRLINELAVVGDTEAHRVLNEAMLDAAEVYAAGHPDKTVMKTWVTMNDDRVRDTHWYLEGVTTERNGLFFTYDGDNAQAPGGFMYPENNINCRCTLRFTTT